MKKVQFGIDNGKQLTEEEFNKRTKKDSCDGEIVEIRGNKYKLMLI